ncbi:hypothetical protein [Methermicoccus shengliensis]|uniref:hypothetical protein n=1 Tax=Methermicoccus shengliensis TaxID=660064 RepID=UPI0005B282F4|nr:hypothetical protein [Methermicoccus shengliensis]
MKAIVKEELMRSIGVFFFALIFTSFLLVKFNLPASFFTVIGIPLLITAVTFAFQVKRRSGRTYEKPNMKDVALHAVIIGIVFAIYGVFYTALTMNWRGFIYLTLLPIFLLWYRRVEGKASPRKVAKYSAQGATIFIFLGLAGASLKGLNEFAYAWLLCWFGLLLASMVYYFKR